MRFIKTLYHYISFLVKLLLITISVPFYLVYIYIKRKRYYSAFRKELKKCGVERKDIKELEKSCLKLSDLFQFRKSITKEIA